jgi:hypothetical protein
MESTKRLTIFGFALCLNACGGGGGGSAFTEFPVLQAFKSRTEKGSVEEFFRSYPRQSVPCDSSDFVMSILPAQPSVDFAGLFLIADETLKDTSPGCERTFTARVFYTTNYVPVSPSGASNLANASNSDLTTYSVPLPSILKVGDSGTLFRAEYLKSPGDFFPPRGVGTDYKVESVIGNSALVRFRSRPYGGQQLLGSDSVDWLFLIDTSGRLELQESNSESGIRGDTLTYTRKPSRLP